MAGYSKGIVDTRKLNKDSKARLGRGGDTKIREVDGRKSHVNALEAYLIDVNGKAGEEFTKRVGAGTVNPLTGMPEYHKSSFVHNAAHRIGDPHKTLLENVQQNVGNVVDYAAGQANPVIGAINLYENVSRKETGISTPGELIADPSKKVVDVEQMGLTPEEDPGLFQGTGVGKKSYDELQAMTPEERAEYMKTEFGIGAGYEQYMTGFQEEPFGFLKDQKDLTTKGLQSSYGATMGALGSREETLGLERESLGLQTRGFDIQEEGLTAQQTALGRTTGRGYAAATGAAATAASRSGLATSGTITSGLETQKKELFQDYTAGVKDIGRQRAGIQIGREGIDIAGRGIDIGMGDIERQRGTALETLTLGKEGAGLDFRTAEYAEKRRQEEQYYDDIGMISGKM